MQPKESNFPMIFKEICIFTGSTRVTLKPTKGEHKTLRQIQAQGSLDPEGGMELGPGTEDGV